MRCLLICLVLGLAAVTLGQAAKRNRLGLSSTGVAPLDDEPNFCQGCRQMVSFFERFNSSSHRSEFKSLFNGFCENYYPVSTDYQQGPCPLATEFVFYLISNMDPIHHCDQIGACGASLEPTMTQIDFTPVRYNIESKYNDVVCNVCVETINEIKEKVSEPDFEQWALKVIKDFCAYLKPINEDQECRTFLVDNGMQAMKFIQNINPKKYCQSIQLCGPAKPQTPSADWPSFADFSNFGIETKVVVDGIVKKNIDSVPSPTYNYQQQVASLAVAKHSTPTCQLCKTVIVEMFKFLRDNRTEENIREALDKVCGLIYRDKTHLEQCEGMVNAYTKELVEILVDETDPQVICTLLDQCLYKLNASSPARASLALAQVSSKPSRRQQIVAAAANRKAPAKEKSVNFGQFLAMMDPTKPLNNMKTCFECKLFIKVIRDNLNDTSTQEELRDFLLNNICAPIPDKSQQDACKEMVQTYSSAFFKAITQELNPQATCEDLGACHRKHASSVFRIDNAPATMTPIQPSRHNHLRQPFKGDSPVCEQCVEIITKIDEYLSKESVDQDVAKIIDNVCNKLPTDSARATCTIMVRTMGADIVQQIATMDNPRQLCSKLMLCSA